MKKLTTLLISLIFIGVTFSQELKPDRRFVNMFYDSEAYMYEGNFDEALQLLLKLHDMDPDNANIQYKIGYCYLNTRINKKNALEFLEYGAEYINTAYKPDNHKERKAPLESLLYLGQAYRYNYQFDKSLEVLNELLTRLSPKNKSDLPLIALAEREIEVTENAIYFVANPVDAQVRNLGSAVNTEFCDHSPVIDMNEEFLIFTSKQ
ncbi:MAG TPA: tetratricopeptide repeat protein, partial [Bacteroidales bacterium]|nr:tetratricopeptide repeat protein [Bacteroidales bacterium]